MFPLFMLGIVLLCKENYFCWMFGQVRRFASGDGGPCQPAGETLLPGGGRAGQRGPGIHLELQPLHPHRQAELNIPLDL